MVSDFIIKFTVSAGKSTLLRLMKGTWQKNDISGK